MVVSVGIDVSKDKHDCFIVNSDGEVLADVFTIPNTLDGFHCLLQRVGAGVHGSLCLYVCGGKGNERRSGENNMQYPVHGRCIIHGAKVMKIMGLHPSRIMFFVPVAPYRLCPLQDKRGAAAETGLTRIMVIFH